VTAERERTASRGASSVSYRRRADRKHLNTRTRAAAGWTWADASAVGAVLLLSLAFRSAVLGSEAVAVMPATGRVATRAVVLGLSHVGLLALLLVLAHRRGVDFLGAFRLSMPGTPSTRTRLVSVAISAGLVVALAVATRVASTAWGALAQGLGWTPPGSESLVEVFGRGGAGLLLAVVIVVVIGPLVEELAFRGVVLGVLAERFGAFAGIAGSALVFALYHTTLWVVVPTFLLGIATGWLATRRPTLWPAISLHSLYNGIVVAAIFLLPA
jgi:membrane protease YdiL (CAAX protease family)